MAGDKKIILITGANTGLGFEIVRALCSSAEQYQILLGGRSVERAEEAVKKALEEHPKTQSGIEAVQIDIDDDKSMDSLFQQVQSKYGRLDVLINNAGAQFDQQVAKGNMTMREAWTKSWTVNTVGTQLMTNTFAPLLLKAQDPRLLFIASGTSSLTQSEDLTSPINGVPPKGWPKEGIARSVPAYRCAKTGMNMMMR